MKPLFVSLIAIGLAAMAQAQTIINFETKDYDSITVYDSWEKSPFRVDSTTKQPKLQGYARVIDNFTKKDSDDVLGRVINPSEKILGFQRSRYGSERYGVRINLSTPLRLTKQNQYLHLMTLIPKKPSATKMMVIGLGKRVEEDWKWQSGEDEQFWSQSSAVVEASDKWQDQVFAFKGFSYAKDDATNGSKGIDIYALVIVPDLTSRSEDAEDFIAYFDSIVVDNNPNLRFKSEYYLTNFDKSQAPTRTDRVLNSVGIRVNGVEQSVASIANRVYSDHTGETFFTVRAGETVTPVFSYKGTWMNGFVYADWDNNGVFSANVNDNGTLPEGSELLTYSFYGPTDPQNGFNSAGTAVSGQNRNVLTPPAFTIPASTPAGLYRMRFKVDWNCIDAGGNTTADNSLLKNGGGIIDVMLNVVDDDAQATITQNGLNGDIKTADEEALDQLKVAAGEPFTIKAVPSSGFYIGGISVAYGGEAVSGERFDKYGNPLYFVRNYTMSDFDFHADTLTLPGEIMYGNVSITSDFHSGTKPLTGDTLKSLSALSDNKTYFIVNKNGAGYLAYNESVSNENLSITGVTNAAATHGLPTNADVAAIYSADVDVTSPNVSWAITKDDAGKYYLFNIGRQAYAYRNATGADTRTYKFTDTKTPLTGIKANAGNTFSFLSGDATYSDGSNNFLCISSNNNPNPVVQWKWNDGGAEFFIISNPNIDPDPTGLTSALLPDTDPSVLPTLQSERVYNLQGQLLQDIPSEGIYIKNRKKYRGK